MIGIFELGSQSTHLIEHRLNELGYQTKLSDKIEDLESCNAIIYSGSHASTNEKDSFKTFPSKPSFFICFAFQKLMEDFGGLVQRSKDSGFAEKKISLLDHPSLSLINEKDLTTWVSHSDSIQKIGKNWTALSHDHPVMIAHHDTHPWMGVQFHPEILHSINGSRIFESFLKTYNIQPDFNIQSHLEKAKEILHEQITDDGEVLVALSGGVDSSVCAKLCEVFLTNKIHLLCIDHGFLRTRDYEDLKINFGTRLEIIDASELFFSSLKDVSDPEDKRKIIAKCFVEAFYRYIDTQPKIKYFVQGTILTDRIESGQTGGQKIKTHHNMLALPETLKVVEPLKFLFKHQVRALGTQIGLSSDFTARQPFPGPGLAIRCEAPVTKENILVCRKAEEILHSILQKHKIFPWQSLFVLLSSKAVGVKGDSRVFQNVGVVKLVDSLDGISATPFPLTSDQIKEITLTLVNKLPLSRVLFDFTPKPPGTIEWQ